MASYTILRHKVEDFDVWRAVFADYQPWREANGEIEYHVYRDHNDDNLVTVIQKWDTLDNAQRYINTVTVKDIMGKGGVVGEPIMNFMEEAA